MSGISLVSKAITVNSCMIQLVSGGMLCYIQLYVMI